MSSTTLILKSARKLFLSLFLLLNLPAQALEGGQPANHLDYPGLVMLSYDDLPDTFSGNKNCTGLVLEQRTILTSADCLYTIRGNPFGSILIPANNIYVHPVVNGEISGGFLLPILNPSIKPNIRASSYVIHPQNFRGLPFYGLAIINLSSNINVDPGLIYNGTREFIGSAGTGLGWKTQDATFPSLNRKYVLNKLSFNLIDGNTNIEGLCYDNYNDTDTVFCGGFRNGIKFLNSEDEGAPIYKTVNGRQAAIGILSNASNGRQFEGRYRYEEYSRISPLENFIKQHAPNTQFWNESSEVAEPDINIIPMLQLLLLTK